jgi:D-galactarolactone cycloisomerase
LHVQTLEAFPIKIKTGVDLRAGTFSYDNFMTVLIRVTCDGQEGWGEAMTRFSPKSTAAMVEEYFSPQLIGKEFDEPSSIWNILFRALQVRGHTRGIGIEALSGIEIALWDVYGQLFKKSVSEILRKNIPIRKKVDAYAGSIYSSRGDIEGQIDHIKQRGFKGAKVKIGLGIEKDLELLKRIRKHWEAGNIVADANCAYQVDEAIRASGLFSQVGISWFEEPIAPEDISGYSRLSKETKVPIGAGESWFVSDFEYPIKEQVVDIFEPSVSRCGGILVAYRAVKEASKMGIRYAPMVGANSAISFAASLQIAAIAENLVAVEAEPFRNPLVSELCPSLPQVEDGIQRIPDGFGLGIAIDKSFVDKHTMR